MSPVPGYREQRRTPSRGKQSKERIRQLRSLTPSEQEKVLEPLYAERFVNQAPQAVYATLLDQGQYLYSIRTMYRLLAKNNEVKERRKQLMHPKYSKPELLATGPNQLWFWDITTLSRPAKVVL